ncbi:MAG: trypsin-like peptidase domain-containing protein [Gemmatimonadetes bacterium]|nr:trypsin-like peptidase domain-containing protein [Gemmatimonadota bacterium]
MRLFFPVLLSAVFFACGDNPLAERVNELEQRLDEVEAAQEEDRLSLLARLDALAVTADNAEEIGAVRAKLNQTTITRREFEDLQERVDELEGQIGDWSGVVHSLQYSVYAVLAFIWNESYSEDDDFFVFTGTGFAVDSGTLVTNGHVIDALIEWNDYIEDFNRTNGTEWNSSWVVVQNLTISLSEGANFFYLQFYRQHPEWDGDTSSPDVGLLYIWEGGYISRRVTLATISAARRLRVGAPIATLGFPGELQGGDDWSSLFPIATFKNGTVSALRPRFEGLPYSALDSYIVQHNLDLSGGTSGSPIFDASGQVVAINNAGIEADFSIEGDWPRISQAALGFGIRVDKIHELLNEAGGAAKPTAPANLDNDELINRLAGRTISSLDIATTEEDLAERLAGMK